MAENSLATKQVLISETGWWITKGGHFVSIQYWDHYFAPEKDARWRGMVVLKSEDNTIQEWQCVWYTVHGEGYIPGFSSYKDEWDIARKLEPDEMPPSKPEAWMPGYDDEVRKRRSA